MLDILIILVAFPFIYWVCVGERDNKARQMSEVVVMLLGTIAVFMIILAIAVAQLAQ